MTTTQFLGQSDSVWSAIGALATAGATIVALISALLAIWLPERGRRQEARSSVRSLSTFAFQILTIRTEIKRQLDAGDWNEESMAISRAKAEQAGAAVSLILARNILTDAAVKLGTGAELIARHIAATPTWTELADRSSRRARETGEIGLARYITARPAVEQAIAMTEQLAIDTAADFDRLHSRDISKRERKRVQKQLEELRTKVQESN